MILKNTDVIILSDSPRTMRSCGSYRVATELRANGYTCQIVDFFTLLKIEDILTALKECVGSSTKVIGFSTTFSDPLNIYGKEFSETRKADYLAKIESVINYCKSLNNTIKVVLGGANVLALESNLVDARIIGYSDVAFVRYIKWLDKKDPFFTYEYNSEGEAIISGDNYNSQFSFQDSEIIYNQCDNIIQNEALVIEFSRGCIFNCKYCSFPLNGKNKNDYIKNKSALLSELLRNYEEYGITKYIASDDTHNDNIYKLEMIAEIKQALPFNLEYATYIRIDLLRSNPEQYEVLKHTGLVGAVFGIETLNHRSGKIIGKGLHPDKVVEELYKFRENLPQVGTSGSFIAGLPYETKDSLLSWTKQIRHQDFPLDTYTIVPLTIDFQEKRAFKSELDTNWAKYYTVNSGVWDNGSFNRDWATAFCDIAYKTDLSRQRLRSGGFFALTYENIGFTEVRKTPFPTRQEFMQKLDKSLDIYRNKLLT